MKSRGIHTVITAHARQQYFTKCQGCPYIIVENIFSLAPRIDVWMFSINSPQAWLKNIDMSTFHNFFFLPNWKAVDDHWWNPESSGQSVEPKQLFKPGIVSTKWASLTIRPFLRVTLRPLEWEVQLLRINVCLWQMVGTLSGLRSAAWGFWLWWATYGEYWCHDTNTLFTHLFTSPFPAAASKTSSFAPSQPPEHLSSPKSSWKK